MGYILFMDVNVLGTIPDWCMVSVTAITAFYLYKTLQSQKEVQTTQTKLFEIESLRFRESVKPILSYTKSKIEFHPGDKAKRMLTIEVANETDGMALEISTHASETTRRVVIPTGLSSRRNHLKKGDEPILLHFIVDSANKLSEWIIFSVTYQDVAGTKYKQGVCCIDDKHGSEINPFLPEILN